MKKADLIRNPYLLFSPFLIIYILIAIFFYSDAKNLDELRYIEFAKNLLNGYYSNPFPHINLMNAPGFSIVLMPFIWLKLPLVCVPIMNAFFYYLSVIFLFKTLQQIVKYPLALGISIFWALYYNSFQNIPLIMSEIFTSFLISFLIYNLNILFNNLKSSKYFIFLSGFTLGYLILTKFIFGYVLLVMILGTIIIWSFDRKSINSRKAMILLIISFAINIPYLAYTYKLTGKILYWGSAGGDTLYWMSSPFDGEYGDWKHSIFYGLDSIPPINVHDNANEAQLTHQRDFLSIINKNQIEQGEALKLIAINNIKSHPVKYIQNCFSNIGRMLFSFPYTDCLHNPKTLIRFPLNGIICVFILFSIIPTYLNWRRLSYHMKFMLFLSFIYLGGSILSSADIRMFTVIVPILLIWIAYILQNTVKINLKFKEDSTTEKR